MPSWPLREPWFRPRMSERIFSLIARPAASSAERLMRWPLDNCSSALLSLPPVIDRFRWALIAMTLVLMIMPIGFASCDFPTADAVRPYGRIIEGDRDATIGRSLISAIRTQ